MTLLLFVIIVLLKTAKGYILPPSFVPGSKALAFNHKLLGLQFIFLAPTTLEGTKPNQTLIKSLVGVRLRLPHAGYAQRVIKSRVCFFRIYLSEYESI